MSKWSLNSKMVLVIAIMSLGAILISYFGIKGMNGLYDGQKSMLNREVKADSITFQLTDQQRIITITTRDIIIAREEAQMNSLIEKNHEARKELFKLLDEYRTLSDEGGKALADEYKTAAENWLASNDEVIALAKLNKDDEVRALLYTTALARSKVLEDTINKINAETAQEVAEATVRSEEIFATSRNLIIFISIISILASLIVAFIILRALSKAITYVINTLTDNSSQVSMAAIQISSSAQSLSEATTEQAASLEQTSSSIEEMSSMVKKNF
jgi:methyl-accepting chemotaxis protein